MWPMISAGAGGPDRGSEIRDDSEGWDAMGAVPGLRWSFRGRVSRIAEDERGSLRAYKDCPGERCSPGHPWSTSIERKPSGGQRQCFDRAVGFFQCSLGVEGEFVGRNEDNVPDAYKAKNMAYIASGKVDVGAHFGPA